MPEESKLVEKLEEKQSEVKFNEEELKQVQNIQQSYMGIQNQFGQVKLAQLRFEQQEGDIKKSLISLQDEEKNFLDGITEKYGQGTLNPETGVFTSVESQNKSE